MVRVYILGFYYNMHCKYYVKQCAIVRMYGCPLVPTYGCPLVPTYILVDQ
jgi:hypothetical protein